MSTKSQDKTCPFCDPSQSYRSIIDGDGMRVIYPKNPACAYHVLIVPKQHISSIDGLDSNQFIEIQKLLKKLVTIAKRQLGQDFVGFQLLSNNGGPQVNQHVMHAHIHVFLRTKKDEGDPLLSKGGSSKLELTAEDWKNMRILQAWFAPTNKV